MIRKSFLLIILWVWLIPSIYAQQKVAKINFNISKYDFGTIKEDGGTVSYSFDFENNGQSHLLIQRVVTSCNCTICEWTKEPIAPGGKGVVKVTYNPLGRPGQIGQFVTVYSNSETPTKVLQITGNVLKREKTFEEIYYRVIGELRFAGNHISFSRININDVKTDTLKYVNTTKDPVKLGCNLLGLTHLDVRFVPEIVKPNEKGSIVVTFNAKKRDDWGFVADRFFLTKDGKNLQDGLITVSASIEEDYSKLTDEQIAKAPKIEFEKPEYDFNQIEEGKDVIFNFKLKNTGKSNLIIHKIKPGCGCTTVNPIDNVIKPGDTISFKATFRTHGYNGRVSKSITVISNDPKSSIINLRITGVVNKKEQKQ